METVRLEPFAAAHLDGCARLLDDPDVLRFTRIPEPPPEGFVEQWIARYEAERRDGTADGFAAIEVSDGRFLGLALAPQIDHEAREAELGYIVAPEARGHGVATAMLRHLTDWGLHELGLLRLELQIGTVNVASQRVAARCGYVYEGTLRSSHLKQDIRSDCQIWSRLPTDPEPATPPTASPTRSRSS